MGIWILSKGSILQQYDSIKVRKNTDESFGTGKGYLLEGIREDEGCTVLADEFPTLAEATAELRHIYDSLDAPKASVGTIIEK